MANSEFTGSKTPMTKKLVKSMVKLAEIACYPLKLAFFEKINGKFEIYGLENPYNQKIREIHHQINETRM